MANKASITQAKYDKAHCRTYGLKLNLETDKVIIDKLASVPSMQGYIKDLIRQDIARSAPVSVSDCTIVPVSVPNKFMNDLMKEAKENNETVSELIWLVALQDMPWLTNK